MDLSSLTKKILFGNFMFVACCMAYLAWWSVAFRPGYQPPAGLSEVLIGITALLGITGLVFVIEGCAQAASPVPYVRIIGAGAAVLIILTFVTMVLMHRMVTTELLLIVFWTCMEICVLCALCGQAVYSKSNIATLSIVVILAASASMVSYMKYYDLEPMVAFYDGMVPLALFAIVTCLISVLPLQNHRK